MRLALVALFASSVASAAPIAVADGSAGSSITFYDEAGPCVGSAKLAVWSSGDAKTRIPGCWVAGSGTVFVSFLDGDRSDVPVGALKKPTSL
jgi:hypothetical protein